MGLSATFEPEATGRAKCKLCEKQILKGQKAIHMHGYQTSGFIHSAPWECMEERMDLEDVAEAVMTAGGK
jgi:hypothetical protein